MDLSILFKSQPMKRLQTSCYEKIISHLKILLTFEDEAINMDIIVLFYFHIAIKNGKETYKKNQLMKFMHCIFF